MTLRVHKFGIPSALVLAAFAACTTPNPNYRKPHSDGSVDAIQDGRETGDGQTKVCQPGATSRCDGDNLIRCSAEGAEVKELCPLGCNVAALRCFDPNPSNGLAKLLDVAIDKPDLNLGDSATIDTDNGEVKVDAK